MAGVLEKKAATRLNTVIVGYFVAVVAAASAGLTLFLVHGVVMIHEIGHDVSAGAVENRVFGGDLFLRLSCHFRWRAFAFRRDVVEGGALESAGASALRLRLRSRLSC